MTSKIAATYAKALFDSANAEERKVFLQQGEALVSLIGLVPKFFTFLNSPEIESVKKEDVLKMAFPDSPKFLEFLSLLLKRGRFKHVKEIIEEYETRCALHYGITNAYLTTAVPLDEGMKAAMKEKLDEAYDQTFSLMCDVDPSCLGGGVLIIGSRMLDFSVKGKLNRLKATLLT